MDGAVGEHSPGRWKMGLLRMRRVLELSISVDSEFCAAELGARPSESFVCVMAMTCMRKDLMTEKARWVLIHPLI